MNLYLTNTDQKDIPASEVQKVYGLRWQIELVFKIWKSQTFPKAKKFQKVHFRGASPAETGREVVWHIPDGDC